MLVTGPMGLAGPSPTAGISGGPSFQLPHPSVLWSCTVPPEMRRPVLPGVRPGPSSLLLWGWTLQGFPHGLLPQRLVGFSPVEAQRAEGPTEPPTGTLRPVPGSTRRSQSPSGLGGLQTRPAPADMSPRRGPEGTSPDVAR